MTEDGVDLRAEVGLLSRNIRIHGEMEESCYADNLCDYFSYDTFGGHIQVCIQFVVHGVQKKRTTVLYAIKSLKLKRIAESCDKTIRKFMPIVLEHFIQKHRKLM